MKKKITPETESKGPFAGEQVHEVEYRDGRKESVVVRQASLREVPVLLRLLSSEDLPARVDWYCGQKTGWSDQLSDESFEQILERGNVLARPTLERWWKLQAKVEGPTLRSLITKTLGLSLPSSVLPEGTPPTK